MSVQLKLSSCCAVTDSRSATVVQYDLHSEVASAKVVGRSLSVCENSSRIALQVSGVG